MQVRIIAIVELDPKWTSNLEGDSPVAILKERLEGSQGLKQAIGFRGKVKRLSIKKVK